MPEFLPGEVKTAVAPITVQPVGLVCDAELYLSPVATSGKISFVSTGLQQTVRLPVMMPAEPGTYHVYLDIHVGVVPLVAYQAIEDVVIAVPLAGSIMGELIWYEGLAGWEDIVSGREIPQNEEIHLAPMWINQSEINIVGHMELSVTYPDGTKTALSAVLNQDKEATPGNGWSVQFAPFLSTQEGTYTLEATLSSAGLVLDSETFELVAVPTAVPFTYSNVWVQRVRCDSATAWNTLNFGCTITNPTDRSITHILTPMYRVETKYGYGDPRTYCTLCGEFSLTLKPGQSYNCNIKGNYYDAEDRRWRCATLLGFSAGVPYGGCVLLRDENGNDSPQGCV